MDVKLNTSIYNGRAINNSEVSLLMKDNKKSALHMSIWEKIKDFFRTDKKSDARAALYDLLHSSSGVDKLDVFNRLKSFASPEYQQYFTKEITDNNEVTFFVDKVQVGKSSLQSLMNVSEQTLLHEMSVPEQSLFLSMLDTLKEKSSGERNLHPDYVRLKMSDEHCHEILNLYRPDEALEHAGTELVNKPFLEPEEAKLLRCLHRNGGVILESQFSAIGYQKKHSGVEFTMLHPSINYLLSAYSKCHTDGSSSTEFNSELIESCNRIYQDYMYNKEDIDAVLNKIYHLHNGTLNISSDGRSNNHMAKPSYMFL